MRLVVPGGGNVDSVRGISLQISLDTDTVSWLGPGSTPVRAIFDILVISVVAVLAHEITTAPWAVVAGLAAGRAASDFTDRLARPPGLLHGALVHWIDTAWVASINLADIALGLAALLAAALGRTRRYR